MVFCFLRTHGLFPSRAGATLLLAASLGILMTPPAEAGGPGHCPPVCNQPPPPPPPPCFPNCNAPSGVALVGPLDGPQQLPDTIPVALPEGPWPDTTYHIVKEPAGDFAAWSRSLGVVVRGGDFDGDGYTDIALSGVVGWATIPVAFSNHDGTFRVTNSFVGDFAIWASSGGVSILAGDFNGDHRTDLALVGVPGWGSVPVAFSNGDGSFTITNSGIVDFASWAAVPGAAKLTGDFDGDGRTDIALTGVQGWGSVPVAFSHGDGTFGVSNYAVTGDFAIKSATQGVVGVTGDFDGDGRTDIALGGNAGWSAVPIAFSAGNGYFNVTNTQAPCQGVVGQAVLNQPGDFNGDGRTDLVLMIPSRACVLLSYGDGSFWDPYGGAIAPELEDIADNTLTWDPAFSIEATHVDSDGRADLLVVGGFFPDAYAAVFNSNGTFAVGAIAYDIHFFGVWGDSPTAVRVFGRFR